MIQDKPLTIGKISKICQVDHLTVLNWILNDDLKAYRTPGRHSRVRKDDLLAFLKKKNLPFPGTLDHETKQKKVLIIDGNGDVDCFLRRLLDKNGRFDIRCADDLFSAGQKFSQFAPEIVILNLDSKKIDFKIMCKGGLLVGKAPVKIVALSDNQESEYVKDIRNMGVSCVMSKKREDALLKEMS